MTIQFVKASKRQARLRMALMGPSGSGKTYTALRVASALVPGGRIALIDTERGSASKYADKFSFDVLELDDFGPLRFVEAIEAAGKAGYHALIIDSLSHAWMGKGGALELVDAAAARQRSGNSFTAWREVTPQHNALVDAMLRATPHLVVTMRTKTEWVLEEDSRGKKVPRKVGLQPVQRDGLEYEFDVVGDLDSAQLAISKTRCSALSKAVIPEPGEQLAETLRAWLTDGAPPAPTTPKPASVSTKPTSNAAPPPRSNGNTTENIKAKLREHLGVETKTVQRTPWDRISDLAKLRGMLGSSAANAIREATGKTSRADLTDDDVAKFTAWLDRVGADQPPPPEEPPPGEPPFGDAVGDVI
jgi:hypothetical protein